MGWVAVSPKYQTEHAFSQVKDERNTEDIFAKPSEKVYFHIAYFV